LAQLRELPPQQRELPRRQLRLVLDGDLPGVVSANHGAHALRPPASIEAGILSRVARRKSLNRQERQERQNKKSENGRIEDGGWRRRSVAILRPRFSILVFLSLASLASLA